MSHWILAFYWIGTFEEPHAEVARHKDFFNYRDLKGRIYISEQGMNAQMSGRIDCAQEYIDWLRADPRFKNLSIKVHEASEHAFPKATIKYRRQLVALDCDVDLNRRGEPVASKQWRAMLEENDPETLVLDVRNDYEWKVGHFEGAEKPSLEAFRQFPAYAKQLKGDRDPKTTRVMMYCTGGIRCEFYSALLKQEGFEQVYQLDGGVIQYGLDEGRAHWEGKLFVFDDRLVVGLSQEEASPISECKHCQTSSDVYYNCANMDCNALFVCCASCASAHAGCCCDACRQTGRVRPQNGSAKPFRKCSHEEKQRIYTECVSKIGEGRQSET